VKDRTHWKLGDVGFPVSNGPAFSGDGGTMYFNDSTNYRTFSYELSPDDPRPRNRTLFASYTVEEGMPDGLTVDAEGCIWTAQWAGARVIRLSPKGEKLATLHVPSGHVTSLAFGGEALDELFITTATDGLSAETLTRYPLSGSLFRFKPGVPGLPEPLFPEASP
jgi:xylono-1,5-lactonase